MDLERARRARRPEPAKLWECDVCRRDTGLASTMTMKVRKNGQLKEFTGRMVGGTFFEVCATCLARGKTTIVCEA